MNLKKVFRNNKIIFCTVIIACTVLMIVLGAVRNQWHIDEVFSYGLSNSYEKPFFFHCFGGTENIDDGVDNGMVLEDEDHKFIYQWHTTDIFKEYITVQPGESFTYGNVYNNQVMDVHPPLYYFVLHTICSFFPDTFSKWFALIPNIVFFILSMLLLYSIAKELTSSEYKSITVMAFWGLSRGAASCTIFLRMYMLMTLLALISVYLHILLIKKEKLSVKYVILISITNIAGFLTQYYFYIFAFFIAAFTCLLLLLRKSWKQLFLYAGFVLSSVGIAILIFPQTLNHMTGGAHGSNAITAFINAPLKFLNKCSRFFQYVFQDCIGINFNGQGDTFDYLFILILKIAVLLLLILLLWLYRQPQSTKTDISNKIKNICGSIKNKNSALFLIVCTVFFTGIFISLIAPKMTNFQDRYWFFILPLCSMLICISLISLAEKYISKIKHIGKNAVPVVICVIFVLSVIGHIPENKFLCQQKGELDINNTVKDRVCFFATEKDYFIHQLTPALSNCDAIYQANALDDTLASEIEKIDRSDGALLMINADEMKLEEADDYVQHLNKKIEYIDIIYIGKAEWTDGYYLYNIEA